MRDIKDNGSPELFVIPVELATYEQTVGREVYNGMVALRGVQLLPSQRAWLKSRETSKKPK